MEELLIEEKAKRYDSMFERLKEMYNNNKTNVAARLICERYFPELKESEDERIRKGLLALIEWSKSYAASGITTDDAKDMIAWLEKQGEQNLANSAKTCKVEPKFKVGDIITPKDGGHEPWQIMQVDILDKKYRFKDGYVIPFSQEDDYELVEQKPAWSEEDEVALGDALWCCKQAASIAKDENDMGNVWFAENWLKSIKERVQPQPKQEWSKEDEAGLGDAMWAIEQARTIAKDENDMGYLWYAEHWLKSLKERYTWKPSDEQMKALKEACDEHFDIDGGALWHLYEDLKKLKE